jgi:hypothetical protein
MVLKG